MDAQLRQDEQELRSGRANLQRGVESVGGELTLTNQRLVFEPHAVNVNTEKAEVQLSAVRDVTPVWTKVFNLVPLVPNSLAVATTEGHEHRFVVAGRDAWRREIEQALER